ncbi:MAG: PD-(D/E)XK nuclease family protein, partial [Chloroflexi bacterium]|nr:PD-(D/E)XK nuclease family protein [Chloroflexota bacterium]
LFNNYVHLDERAPSSESDSKERVLSIIDELRGVEELRAGATLSDFSLAVEEAMRGSRHHAGTTGQGVFVAPLGAAAGMDFDVVHILGMVEGIMPPRIESDPLLPEDDRLAAGGPAAGIPLQQARRGEEVRAYLSALATAPVRVLSYPTADIAAQRINFPSRWFVEAASQLEGAPLYASSLSKLGARPWLTTITSVEQGLISAIESSEADLNEFSLRKLLGWKRSGRRLSDHPLVDDTILERAFRLNRRRQSSDLTAWDGDVSAIAGESEYSDRVNRPVYSPTSLERWAVCPYRYFLGDVLGISDIEEPEDAHTISPLEKGSLVHGILERFMREHIESGSLPRPNEAWDEQHVDDLLRLADEEFRDAEQRGVTGKALLWQIEKANIRSDLRDFLEEDSRYRAELGVTTKMVEARFGMSGESWGEATLELDGGEVLKFRGIIDRVDVDATGRHVIVLDYKTGGSDSYKGIKKDPVDGGKRLQLPIYSIAALRALGSDNDVKAAYWFTSGTEKVTRIPEDLSSFEAIRGAFKAAVSTITAGHRAGLFPANPGDRGNNGFVNCAHCDFDSLCLSRRDYIWGRKRQDPRLRPYLRLSGDGE